ncbi:hypothetical protein [Streptomyces sp. NPDC047315]|uniref:hypothetical protein n=1 Tax=Streptomyces sp. NPDC047315 TaxID=3155142 RepID=UPI0033EA639D
MTPYIVMRPLIHQSDADLMNLRNEANEILDERNRAALPGKVLKAVETVLMENEPGAPAPVFAEFSTDEQDDGFCWDIRDPMVTLADGSTRTLDLSDHHPSLGTALGDYSSSVEPNDSSTLLVTFEPLALEPSI